MAGRVLALSAALAAVAGAAYEPCPAISVAEVGFNYVRFKGDLLKVRALEINRHRGGAQLSASKPMLYEFARELPGRELLASQDDVGPGVVALLASDGFRVGRWYLVCGSSSPPYREASSGCEECAVVRFCDCDCSGPDRLFLNVTTGKIPVKDNWNSVGLMLNWELAQENLLPTHVDMTVTWDPYDCRNVPGEPDLCERPSINKRQLIMGKSGSETLTVNKARANIVRLNYDLVIDLSSLRRRHPSLNIPDAYVFARGPLEFSRRLYRRLASAAIAIPFPGNERGEVDIRATCRLIRQELDGASPRKAARSERRPTSAAAVLSLATLLPTLLLL